MRIEIPIFEGFDEIDAFGPFEVLSSAGFPVSLVGGELIDERVVDDSGQARTTTA